MPGLPGGFEWVIIALVALLLFGGSRLAGIGKSAGRAIREFKEETASGRKPEVAPEPPPTAELPGQTAGDVVDADIVDIEPKPDTKS